MSQDFNKKRENANRWTHLNELLGGNIRSLSQSGLDSWVLWKFLSLKLESHALDDVNIDSFNSMTTKLYFEFRVKIKIKA